VVTEPNPLLGAEGLVGAELGVARASQARGETRWRLRGSLFWMELEDAIANITLEVSPGLIRRQRLNVGRTRSRGTELEVELELPRGWRFSGGWLHADAQLRRFAAEPDLEGRRVAQVPRHQGTLQARWLAAHGSTAALQARWLGDSFDDDRNLLPLGSAFVVDLRVSRPVGRGSELFAAAENLLDREYLVGRTPLPTVASPRLVRVGLRWSGGRG
jgi:outer membrane receptor protein involved in Fe transport